MSSPAARDPRRQLHWKKFGGYDEKHQLVNKQGRIVGEVLGSSFRELYT